MTLRLITYFCTLKKPTMMKKVLLLALVIMAYGYASAQQTIALPKDYKNYPSSDKFSPSQSTFSKQGGSVNGWFDPEEFIRNNATGPFDNFVSLVFPDSTVVNVNQNNEVSSVFSHAWGHLFDLRHENWAAVPSDPNNPIQPFAQRDSYTWDSVGFAYLYRRNNADVNVVDTCFVYYYNNAVTGQIRRGSIIFNTGDTMLYAGVEGLDQARLSGESFFKVDTVLLTAADTTTFSSTGWGSRFMILPVGATISRTTGDAISRNPASWFAYTVTFRPGHAWNVGDTIESRGFTRPANGVNYFGYRFVSIDQNNGGLPVTLRSRNYADNSLILYSSTRYGQTLSTGWSGFMPGSAFNSPIFNNTLARVSGVSTTSAREVQDLGFSLGKAFPNPVANGNTLFIDYALKTAGNVTIEIYDLLGKKVATVLNNEKVEAGEHTASTTVDFQPGVYFYTLKSGDVLIGSKKINVVR